MLYNLCLAYLEAKNLPILLSIFKNRIEPYYTENNVLKSRYDIYAEEPVSSLLNEYRKILYAFPAFGDSISIDDNKGIVYLEHILESTSVIIKDKNIIPKSEKSVYDAVKSVCKAVFSDFIHPTHSFQKTAKCYVPDILIPSLKCAIEYKYATNEQRLIESIDQILVDVKGYAGNTDYNIFYAVFYVTPGIWSRKRFLEIWKEKEFPDNWKGVFVEGN